VNCDETRDRLGSYVAGDAGDEARAVAEHLARCAACAAEETAMRQLADELRRTGDAFRPRLLPADLTLARAAQQARRRRVALLAAACVAGVLAAVVVSLALPVTARHAPLPVGAQLRRLDDRLAALDTALAANTRDLARARAELGARRHAARYALTPAALRAAGHEAGVLKSISTFFAARAAAAMPTSAGSDAKTRLAQVTVPGSQAAQTSRYFALGVRRTSSPSLRLSERGAVVLVTGLQMLSESRAVAFVRPFSYASWVASASSSTTGAEARQAYWSESDHRVVLDRSATGDWLVSQDVSSDPLVTRALRAGGAPRSLVAAAQASSSSQIPAAALVPPDAVQTVKDVLDLVNQGEYAQTAGLFADGKGIAASSVDAWWSGGRSPRLQLKGVQLMVYSAGSRPGPADHLYVQVDADSDATAAHPLFVAGGPGLPAFWELEHAPDGRWLVVSMNTGP
jgi:hypothetical protein